MKTILKTQFASYVYGTNLPTSDLDYKYIFIPDVKDIILQKAPTTIIQGTKEDKTKRNSPGDIDIEMFSLQQYLKLLMEGQTVALDILFTPEKFYQEIPLEPWKIIKENKHKFLHKGTASYFGYAKQQAAKYGLKGHRVAALRQTLDKLNSVPNPYLKLKELNIEEWISEQNNEHIKLTLCKAPNNTFENHLEVCNRKIPFHATIKYTKEIFERIFNEYGARSLMAEQNLGIDWKALMHSVRVCEQAKELLSTGNITFPRPEKDLLLQIRKGELPYKQVAELIENGLLQLEEVKLKSTLQETPDYVFAEEIVYETYKREIFEV